MKKILISENQYKNLNELFPEKLYNLYKTNKETQSFNPNIDFKLKFKNRITDNEYFQLNQGVTTDFTDEEQMQLSLVFQSYRKSYQHIYGFKYSKRTFGEPAIELNGFITKFKSYYLLDLKYKITLPHAKGRDDCFGLFYKFKDLLKFLQKLISLNIPEEQKTF